MEDQSERTSSRSEDDGRRPNTSASKLNNTVHNSQEHFFGNHSEEVATQTEDIALVRVLPVGPQDQTVREEAVNAIEIGDFNQIGLLQRNVDDIEDFQIELISTLAFGSYREHPSSLVDLTLPFVFTTTKNLVWEQLIRTIRISERHINNYNNITSSCPICLFDFEMGEEVFQLECGHIYHRRCLSQWFWYGNTCPLCQYQIRR